MRIEPLVFLPVVALLLTTTLTNAATVQWRTEQEMALEASAIVRGSVLNIQPRWQGELIVTEVTIQTARIFKGAAKKGLITLVQLGGVMGDKTLHVPGNSKYHIGEEVLVFFEANNDQYVEMGIGAGKYLVDRHGPVALIKRQLGAVAFARVKNKKATPLDVQRETRAEPLADFETRLLNNLKVGG